MMSSTIAFVMAGFVPRPSSPVSRKSPIKTWMPGTRPGTTDARCRLSIDPVVVRRSKPLRLHRQMHLVLECGIAVRREQPGIVGNSLAEGLDPATVTFGEIRQHVAVDQFLYAGMANSQPHAPILVANMRGDRTQPVVTGDAAANLDAHLGWRQFELVLKHRDFVCSELEEIRSFLNRAPGVVHESRGTKQDHPLMIERAFSRLALKAPAPWCETMTTRNLVKSHEADVVPVVRVLRAGIAKSNKESHDAASRASARSAKVDAGFASDRAPTYGLAHNLSANRSHFGGSCALLLLVATAGRRLGAGRGSCCCSRGSGAGGRRSRTRRTCRSRSASHRSTTGSRRSGSRSCLLFLGVARRRHNRHQRHVFARQRLHACRQLDIGQMQRVADLEPADVGVDILRNIIDGAFQ